MIAGRNATNASPLPVLRSLLNASLAAARTCGTQSFARTMSCGIASGLPSIPSRRTAFSRLNPSAFDDIASRSSSPGCECMVEPSLLRKLFLSSMGPPVDCVRLITDRLHRHERAEPNAPPSLDCSVHTRALRDAQEQKLHLVREDFAIAEDESLVAVRHVRHVVQLHARGLRRAVGLAVIARLASRDEIHPRSRTALRARHDVLHVELIEAEALRAVGADIA